MTHPARRPRRIQRRRVKGWTMPKAARFVGRGTPFGNGWRIGDPHPDTGEPMDRATTVALYARSLLEATPETLAIIRRELGGRDLACWCRLDQDCHADLLLTVANARSRALALPTDGRMVTIRDDDPAAATAVKETTDA